jgi:diaminopimelate epimerase
MTGGALTIDTEQTDGKITDLYLTGPTNLVAKGEVTDEDLSPAK